MRAESTNRFVEIVSSIFILLFVYTALSKFLDLNRFVIALNQSPLINSATTFLSIFIPTIEILLAALLFFPFSRKLGMLGCFILMIAFTCYVGTMILFSTTLPCACGGVFKKMSWPLHFWFNIVFTIAAGLCIYISRDANDFIRIKQEMPKT